MKITAVKVWLVECIKYNWTLLKVYTDTGQTGVGEATNWPGSPIVEAAAGHVGERVLGLDPLRTDFIWTKLYRDLSWIGPAGAALCAISGLDRALLDLKAKVLGVPMYQLLGGAFRTEIVLSANYWFTGGQHIADDYAAGPKGDRRTTHGSNRFRIPPPSAGGPSSCIRSAGSARRRKSARSAPTSPRPGRFSRRNDAARRRRPERIAPGLIATPGRRDARAEPARAAGNGRSAAKTPGGQRHATAEALAAQAGDTNEHNLPLMLWSAIEPIAALPGGAFEQIVARARIPLLQRFGFRRLAEGIDSAPERLNALLRGLPSEKSTDMKFAALDGGRHAAPSAQAFPSRGLRTRSSS